MARQSLWALVIVSVVAAAGAAVAFGSRGDAASVRVCNKFASPRGSDHARGTRRRPFRTPQRLVNSLRPGQTGCLRQGVYSGELRIRRRGTARRRITLRNTPGEAAKLAGYIVVTRRAEHVTVRGLYLDGRNEELLPSPAVMGRDISFTGNDVTNGNTGICFVLGHPLYGTSQRVVIRGNRIHHCGRLPATNHDHGVYVSNARRTQIVGNWIYANADRGVQLYPDAQLTYVAGNVIDGNGEGVNFGGEHGAASRDNLLEGNVIGGSTQRLDVESYYPPGQEPGSGNVVRRNCIGGGVTSPPIGFSAVENLFTAPRFQSKLKHDYRMGSGGPCGTLFAGDPRAVPGPRRRAPRGLRPSR